MEHPIMEFLSQTNSENSLLEELLDQVWNGQSDLARNTAAKIKATRDIRFTLKKLIIENDHLRDVNPKTEPKAKEA